MTARMPGALPHLCTASGAGLRTARAGVRASFVVLAFDAEGKRKLIGGDAFAARLIGPLPSAAGEGSAGGEACPAWGEVAQPTEAAPPARHEAVRRRREQAEARNWG